MRLDDSDADLRENVGVTNVITQNKRNLLPYTLQNSSKYWAKLSKFCKHVARDGDEHLQYKNIPMFSDWKKGTDAAAYHLRYIFCIYDREFDHPWQIQLRTNPDGPLHRLLIFTVEAKRAIIVGRPPHEDGALNGHYLFSGCRDERIVQVFFDYGSRLFSNIARCRCDDELSLGFVCRCCLGISRRSRVLGWSQSRLLGLASRRQGLVEPSPLCFAFVLSTFLLGLASRLGFQHSLTENGFCCIRSWCFGPSVSLCFWGRGIQPSHSVYNYTKMMSLYKLYEPFQVPNQSRAEELDHITDCRCPRVYWPVCAYDNVTYANPCIMNCFGQTKRRYGPCITYRRNILIRVPLEWKNISVY
ncbi:unnamed protein product [Leptidea sinapis]|uniref:Kazal-like domain-containing protein n=1 Tax=Leptidea sinapis TaxID=189913 RepID=A0A5E4PMY5_9NEOP|nr:unnamed protein product [Leptidea sinapis]